MKICNYIISAVFILSVLALNGQSVANHNISSESELKYASDYVVLTIKPNQKRLDLTQLLATWNSKVIEQSPYYSNLYTISVPKTSTPIEFSKLLEGLPFVASVEPDYICYPTLTPNDPNISSQYSISIMNLINAWDCAEGDGIIIGIADSGCDPKHSDLKDKYVEGWNIAFNHSDWSDGFGVGHGTKVASVAAAATNNGIGMAGIAWNARIMPLEITSLASGSAYTSTMANAIYYANTHGARVVNISYGGLGSSTINAAAAVFKSESNGIVLMSSGNANEKLVGVDNIVIGVGSTTSTDTRSGFSNYGEMVDITAPGSGIYAALQNWTYGSVSGTSFSSPNAAGVVALMVSANPSLPADTIEKILESTAVDLGATGYDIYYGHGRINAQAAVCAAAMRSKIKVLASVTHISGCKGAANGIIDITVSGGQSPYTYKWSNGVTSQDVSNLSAASYSVTITDNLGNTQKAIYAVSEPDPLNLVLKGVGYCSTVGKGYTKNKVYGGTDPYTYSWSTGATGIDITNVSPATYTLTVKDSKGCSTTGAVNVPNYTIMELATSLQSGCKNDGKVTASITGGMADYQYKLDGTLKATLTQSTYTITSVEAGPHTVQVTDKNGCTTSASVTVNVSSGVLANAGIDKSICVNDSTLIGSPPVANYTYSWTPTTSLSSSTISNPITKTTSTRTYTVTATNTITGCYSKDIVVITANVLPAANAGLDVVKCSFEPAVSIGASPVSGRSYDWTPVDGLSNASISNPTANPNSSITYFLTVINTSTGCKKLDTVIVTINSCGGGGSAGNDVLKCLSAPPVSIGTPPVSGMTYSWSPSTGLSSSTISNPTANPLNTTIYKLTVTNSSASVVEIDTVVVTVNPLPTADAGLDKVKCSNDPSVNIGAPPISGFTYSWLPITGLSNASVSNPSANPGSTTTYTLTVTNSSSGCKKTSAVLVSVNATTTPLFNTLAPVCQGATSPVLPTISTNNISGVWSPAVSTATSGTKTYTFTPNSGQCANTTTLNMTVTGLPSIVVSNNSSNFICENMAVQFDATATTGGDSYSWSFLEGNPSITTSSSTKPTVSFGISGTHDYKLVVLNSCGSSIYNGSILIDICTGSVDLVETNLLKIYFDAFNNINLSFINMGQGNYNLHVLNSIGQVVVAERITLSSREQQLILPFDTHANGIYFVHVFNAMGATKGKFLKHSNF